MSDDYIRMDEIVEYFEDAFDEEGFSDDFEINTHDGSTTPIETVVAVRGRVNGERIGSDIVINERELIMAEDQRQLVASKASQCVQDIRSYCTSDIEWGDHAVRYNEYTDGVTCLHCGTGASLDDLSQSPMRAETSVPRPASFDPSSIDGQKKEFLLLALLRRECEEWCPNSPIDSRFVNY